jgi:hypothetical protein
MRCQRCSGALNSIPPSFVKAAKFGISVIVVGSSAILAKSIYELSLQVLKDSSNLPYGQFVALGCGVVATAYYSWQLSVSLLESKGSEKTIHISPRPGSPEDKIGEFVGIAKGASQ